MFVAGIFYTNQSCGPSRSIITLREERGKRGRGLGETVNRMERVVWKEERYVTERKKEEKT